VNRTRRLIKAPKLFWADTALALHLAGESAPRAAHLENLILADLLAWRDLQPQRLEVLYWRTAAGQEVDFVIETPKRLLPIEVKAAARVTPTDAKGSRRSSTSIPISPTGRCCSTPGPSACRSQAASWPHLGGRFADLTNRTAVLRGPPA
jgi:predicted AAA+ superfamily ATPase